MGNMVKRSGRCPAFEEAPGQDQSWTYFSMEPQAMVCIVWNKPALGVPTKSPHVRSKNLCKNCVHAEIYVYRKVFLLATKAQKAYSSIEAPCKHVEIRICKTLVKKLKQKFITS